MFIFLSILESQENTAEPIIYVLVHPRLLKELRKYSKRSCFKSVRTDDLSQESTTTQNHCSLHRQLQHPWQEQWGCMASLWVSVGSVRPESGRVICQEGAFLLAQMSILQVKQLLKEALHHSVFFFFFFYQLLKAQQQLSLVRDDFRRQKHSASFLA